MKERDIKGGLLAYLMRSSDPVERRIEVAEKAAAIPPCPKYGTHACTHFCDAVPNVLAHLEDSGETPTHEHLVENYGLTITLPKTQPNFAMAREFLAHEDLRRVRLRARKTLTEATKKAGDVDGVDGSIELLEAAVEKIRELRPKRKTRLKTGKELYEERLTLPDGPRTGVPEIDSKIVGIEPGTMAVIGGFTGSFKTTWLLNILYLNCTDKERKFNGVFLTLEITREVLIYELLSRHSYNEKFREIHPPVPYNDLRHKRVQPGSETWNFLFDVVEPDLFGNPEYGKILVIEEADLDVLSVEGIRRFMKDLDFLPDLICLDYAQLTKYVNIRGRLDERAALGMFVRQFAEMIKDFDGNKHRVAGVVAAQTNREGFERAQAAGGRYDLYSLADASELEKSARYVMYSYGTPDLTRQHKAKVSLHKQNLGEVFHDPVDTYVEPEFAVFGDESQLASDKTSFNFKTVFGLDLGG